MRSSWIVLIVVGFLTFVSATDKIVCYYGSWATYRNGNGKVSIEDINSVLCSHIIYSFVGVSSSGDVQILDEWNDIQNGGFNRFVKLKYKNPKVKLLVAIGGWSVGSIPFSRVVNSPSLRSKFIDNIYAFAIKYNFDGFDIDWEYPAQNGGIPSDRAAFVELISGLRKKFDQRGLLLTAAVGATSNLLVTSYDVPNLNKYLDFINLMSYDFHGTWDGVTGQNSPLYPSNIDRNKELNVAASVKNWIKAGADPKKIILGIGLYGRSFTLSNPDNNGLGAPIIGPGNSGPYTDENGLLSYLEICESQRTTSWSVRWDDIQKNPYAFKGNQWLGYDNAKSVAIKAQYAVNNNLGGVMVWAIDYDDLRNVCKGGSLLQLIGSIINLSPGTGTTTATTLTTSTTKIVTTTPGSTTTMGSSGSVECTSGLSIRDPTDCNRYYACISDGRGGYIPISMACPASLVFDVRNQYCNYPSAVPECLHIK